VRSEALGLAIHRTLEEIVHKKRYDSYSIAAGRASELYEDIHPAQRVRLLAGDPTSNSHHRTGRAGVMAGEMKTRSEAI
jgi:hypothetical protein